MMRAWASVAVGVAALIAAGVARADSPPGVYSDYAEDGVLSCGHSRAALKGVLNDASLQQYGDPLTFLGLKLAIRMQLAGGCRRKERAALPIRWTSVGAETTAPSSTGGTGSSRAGAKTRQHESVAPPRETLPSAVGELGSGNQQDGRLVLLGVALLLVTLGCGGWAARRAFGDEP
jgi:hypothetical protein